MSQSWTITQMVVGKTFHQACSKSEEGLVMPHVQNFFHKALAVFFAKVQYLYFKRKLSTSSIEWYHFPVTHAMYAEVTLVLIFPIQTSIEQKCKHVPLVLHWFVRHKYLCEDHSMAQTVVSLSSSYTKSFWRTSCFFQKGQSSGIARRAPECNWQIKFWQQSSKNYCCLKSIMF